MITLVPTTAPTARERARFCASVIADYLHSAFGDRFVLDEGVILVDGAPRGALAEWAIRMDASSSPEQVFGELERLAPHAVSDLDPVN